MTISSTRDDMQRAGFRMGGEPLVALDLADTLTTVTEPVVDLIESADRAVAWWQLERGRLPEATAPTPAVLRRVRAAVRDLFDAHLEGRSPRPGSIEDINAAAAAVPASPGIGCTGQDARMETRWHTEHGGNAALAAIARETIEPLTSPERLRRLRRCASPECSMLFLAGTARRQWCAGNACGNRARVARHYARTRAAIDINRADDGVPLS